MKFFAKLPIALPFFAAGFVIPAGSSSSETALDPIAALSPAEAEKLLKPGELPQVPRRLPERQSDGLIYLPGADGKPRATTLDADLQDHLTEFLASRGNPIASVVVAEVATGRILAMAEGASPESWGAATHTALHTGFPAASLFKTVVAATAIELADWNESQFAGLAGGCGAVAESGYWLREDVPGRANQINLTRAFGRSCNGYFARMAVNSLGLGPIASFAQRFGWTGRPVGADFAMTASPIRPPQPENSSAHTVGRWAAGFGGVGVSPVHAAWMNVALARGGEAIPLQLFADTNTEALRKQHAGPAVVSPETASRLRQIMHATTRGGTAQSAFQQRKYRGLADLVGGKTGTLTGQAPRGLTTWFTGMMPLDKPEVVVAAVVIIGSDKWFIKGPNLAAEAFWAYQDIKQSKNFTATAKGPTHENIP